MKILSDKMWYICMCICASTTYNLSPETNKHNLIEFEPSTVECSKLEYLVGDKKTADNYYEMYF